MAATRFLVPLAIAKLIRGLHPDLKAKIRNGFDEIRKNPEVGKPLQKELAGLRSYRIGRFRIVYRPNENTEIVAVGPRRSIYEETLRKLESG